MHGGRHLRCDLSHSREFVMLAGASGGEVGVDVESHRPVDVVEISKQLLGHPRLNHGYVDGKMR